MNNDGLISELRDAAMTIRELRRQNEILRAKVDTMELLGVFLSAQIRQPSQGAVIDVAWQLDRRIQQLEDEPDLRAKAAAETAPSLPETP